MPCAVKCLRTLYQIHVSNSSVKQPDTKQNPKSCSLPTLPPAVEQRRVPRWSQWSPEKVTVTRRSGDGAVPPPTVVTQVTSAGGPAGLPPARCGKRPAQAVWGRLVFSRPGFVNTPSCSLGLANRLLLEHAEGPAPTQCKGRTLPTSSF